MHEIVFGNVMFEARFVNVMYEVEFGNVMFEAGLKLSECKFAPDVDECTSSNWPILNLQCYFKKCF
jgi:hypothetical protein